MTGEREYMLLFWSEGCAAHEVVTKTERLNDAGTVVMAVKRNDTQVCSSWYVFGTVEGLPEKLVATEHEFHLITHRQLIGMILIGHKISIYERELTDETTA